MELMAIPFPSIDPVAIALGPFQVRWYGLAYLAGLVLGWLYMRRLLDEPWLWRGQPLMKPAKADDFLLWATLGVVLGGRLGYVLFYEPITFLSNPAQIFAVWNGGMSFHGGLLGVILAMYLFSGRNNLNFLSLGDLCAATVPFGLFFGRIANFINGELYGKPTDLPWGMKFPVWDQAHKAWIYTGNELMRHPSQLYEAFMEGIVLFAVIRYLTHSRDSLKRPGLTAGVFLCGYAIARILVEFVREWDYGRFFTTEYFSTGQVYSIPMFALGVYLIARAIRYPQEVAAS